MVLKGLRRSGENLLWAWGWFNIALVMLNNFLYYTPGMLILLPLVQKISFVSFLVWCATITISIPESGIRNPASPT